MTATPPPVWTGTLSVPALADMLRSRPDLIGRARIQPAEAETIAERVIRHLLASRP